MSRVPRVAAMLAVLALPVCAVVISLLPLREPEPPRVPDVVRVGESAPQSAHPPTATSARPTTDDDDNDDSRLPPPPPADDDEFDDLGDPPDDEDSPDDG